MVDVTEALGISLHNHPSGAGAMQHLSQIKAAVRVSNVLMEGLEETSRLNLHQVTHTGLSALTGNMAFSAEKVLKLTAQAVFSGRKWIGKQA